MSVASNKWSVSFCRLLWWSACKSKTNLLKFPSDDALWIHRKCHYQHMHEVWTFDWFLIFITALHWMQGGLVTIKMSVCLSVRLSNMWFVTKRMKLVPTVLYHMNERSFILVLWQEECLVGATPSPLNFGSSWPPLERKCWFSVDIRS